MAHLTGTFHRPTHVVPDARAGVVVAAVVMSVALAGLVAVTRPVQAPEAAVPVAPATTRAAILARLDSEHLRAISRGWYVTAPRVNPNQLYSEYLPEIARDWVVAMPNLNRNL